MNHLSSQTRTPKRPSRLEHAAFFPPSSLWTDACWSVPSTASCELISWSPLANDVRSGRQFCSIKVRRGVFISWQAVITPLPPVASAGFSSTATLSGPALPSWDHARWLRLSYDGDPYMLPCIFKHVWFFLCRSQGPGGLRSCWNAESCVLWLDRLSRKIISKRLHHGDAAETFCFKLKVHLVANVDVRKPNELQVSEVKKNKIFMLLGLIWRICSSIHRIIYSITSSDFQEDK